MGLEKILEEIENHAIEFEAFGVSDDYISVGWVKDIIRKHMNDGKDTNVPTNDGWIPVEVCPMPENDGVYEVTKLIDDQHETAYIKQEGGWSSCVGPMEGKIIAWRFGPEPYRPEKGEE